MPTVFLSITVWSVLAPPVESPEGPETLLSVRTTPAGAKVLLGEESVGTTDDVFSIEPGVGRIVIELDGRGPGAKELAIRAGKATRIELQLKEQSGTLRFGPVVERVLRDVGVGGKGYIDLDTGKVLSPPEGLIGDAEVTWPQEMGIDASIQFGQVRPDATSGSGSPTIAALGAVGPAVLRSVPNDAWTLSAEELVDRKGSSFEDSSDCTALAPVSLPATFVVATGDRSMGVFQVTAMDSRNRSVSVRYRLVRATAEEREAVETVSESMHLRTAGLLTRLPLDQRQTATRMKILDSGVDALVAEMIEKIRILPQTDAPTPLELIRADLRFQTLLAYASSSEEARKEVVQKAAGIVARFADGQDAPDEWQSGHDAMLLLLSFLGHEESLDDSVAVFRRLQAAHDNPVDREDWIPIDSGHNEFFYTYWDTSLVAYAAKWDDDGHAPRPPKWIAVRYRALRREDQKTTYRCAGQSLEVATPHGLSGLVGRIWEFEKAMQGAGQWEPPFAP